jgi:lincosamide nucleotidyltransferase A/C/D/E
VGRRRIELAHPDGRRVDLHPVAFAPDGSGTQPGLEGTVFTYPAGCSTTGRIAGREVHCLTAAQQIAFRRGFEPRPVDRHDLALLERL